MFSRQGVACGRDITRMEILTIMGPRRERARWLLVRTQLFMVFTRFLVSEVACDTCADSRSEFGYHLTNHVMDSFRVDRISRCLIICNENPVCQSMNFNRVSRTCQLNNETKKSRPEDFLRNKEFIHAENIDRGECCHRFGQGELVGDRTWNWSHLQSSLKLTIITRVPPNGLWVTSIFGLMEYQTHDPRGREELIVFVESTIVGQKLVEQGALGIRSKNVTANFGKKIKRGWMILVKNCRKLWTGQSSTCLQRGHSLFWESPSRLCESKRTAFFLPFLCSSYPLFFKAKRLEKFSFWNQCSHNIRDQRTNKQTNSPFPAGRKKFYKIPKSS